MEKIDFVIAWVDGNDKAWQEEKSKYQTDLYCEDDKEVRYRDWDNLQYWFRAVETYTPWVNKIFFVTWGHVPQWLNTAHPKLCIVKHEDYIPKEYLPTFNSHTIELNLHRIEGLSEQFVYFNDDMFVNAAMEPEDFFKGGLPRDILGLDSIAFGKNSAGMFNGNDVGIINDHFNCRKCFRKNPEKWLNFRYGIKVPVRSMLLLRRTWFPGFFYQHLANNYLKSTFEKLWRLEPDILDKTCQCKFRNVTNVNQWLMKYWQLAEGNFCPRRKAIGRSYPLKENADLAVEAILSGRDKLICLNDTLETVNFDGQKKQILEAFQKKLPDKSSFEK